VTTPECPHAYVLVMIQACVGTFIQAVVTGFVLAKLSRPKHRADTIMFSRTAVVCKRDSEYQLLFRIADMRRSHFIGASVRAVLIKDRYIIISLIGDVNITL